MKFFQNVRSVALSGAFVAAVVLTGCGTPNYQFTEYVGQQQNWTTAPGSFVRTVNGVPMYTQYPSKPYELIGAVIVNNEKALARAVKYYKGDAAIVYRKYSDISGTMGVAGPGVYMGYPLTESRITAQIIRFKN